VLLFDTQWQKIKASVVVGDNPNEIILNKKNTLLYVANANDNSVSVIDLTSNAVIETLNAALYPEALTGSTTNGLALSEDEKFLYIANADNNCLAVFDVGTKGSSHAKGFIPTAWYPTSVRTVHNSLWITNGKGLSSLPNPYGPNPTKKKARVVYQQGDTSKRVRDQYIGGLFHGTLTKVQQPMEQQLEVFSQAVYKNTPYSKEREKMTSGIVGNPVPRRVGDASPIKYVFYIIKENRTYDQVLSDIAGGNGDTSLLLFGRNITPNQHALAEQFVLLDNFYVDGEVSADGHNWSTAAYATDFLEKNWPSSYGGRGGHYYGEGTREAANNKHGFIWDYCKRFGVSYRTYGEFADDFKPNIPALKDHFCPYFTSWDESVMDTTRFHQWRRDFDSLLALDKVPQFNSLRFINDHTEGLRIGRPSPTAHVADNDLAVGLFVDYLSKSKIWNESVVFIVEDDAQNGPDHVDAHRTTAYVAGGMVKRNFIDHTMYTTSSMLRTMELILGLPPMSQYDAAAEPMWRCFNDSSISRGFDHIPNQIDLFEVNTAYNEWQKKSETFDFSKEDRVADAEFNAVLWYAVKGAIPCPPPIRSAFLKLIESGEED
jgi:YVTN family beta-propeller protein